MQPGISAGPGLRRDCSAAQIAAWSKRRPAWSRNETTRWLDARSEGVLAWLRRTDPASPGHSSAMGRWVKEHRPALFARVHVVLAAPRLEADRREQLSVPEVLR